MRSTADVEMAVFLLLEIKLWTEMTKLLEREQQILSLRFTGNADFEHLCY